MERTTTHHDTRITITSDLDGNTHVMAAALVCKWGNQDDKTPTMCDSLTVAHEQDGDCYTVVYVVNSACPEPQGVYVSGLSAAIVAQMTDIPLPVIEMLGRVSNMCPVRS